MAFIAGAPISIHSPRMGRDDKRVSADFLRTISIHSPRMGRDGKAPRSARHRNISIHSPRMGRDIRILYVRQGVKDFNPLSPHGERLILPAQLLIHQQFQSTLPAWGETVLRCIGGIFQRNFNPLSPHGERRMSSTAKQTSFYFNPLSPHGERRHACYHPPAGRNFNPLSPHGERHQSKSRKRYSMEISIHSPRMGRDLLMDSERQCFYLFQSTLPAWGETSDWPSLCRHLLISIHSPRMGRDQCQTLQKNDAKDFNPLSPHGERQGKEKRT